MLFPKKKRIVDKKAIIKYGLENPYCELCGALAVDVHHIIFKSQGGHDIPENFFSLCRPDHNKAHGENSRAWKYYFLEMKQKS